MMNGDVLRYCCQADFPSDRLKLAGPLICQAFLQSLFFFFFQIFYQVISKVISYQAHPWIVLSIMVL